MADPLIGKLVANRFEVRRVLGHGGMGAVYEAVQQPVGRRVALKVLKNALRGSDRLQRRFLREAQAIAHLNHPNIVTLYDFGIDDEGLTYIAMEYVEGLSLFDVMDEEIDIEFIVHIMAHVIDALIEAHSHGIVHRDLKPENIMLTSMGGDDTFAKVLDFGLARIAESEADVALTAAGEVFGTPLYMSPEQANGEEVTTASDIYALGCILFQLLSGEPPFYSERPMTLLMMHTNDPIPELVPRSGVMVSPALIDIVRKCLAKEPEDRFSGAGELLDAMGRTPEGVYIVDAKTSGRIDSMIPRHRPNTDQFSRPPADTESLPPLPGGRNNTASLLQGDDDAHAEVVELPDPPQRKPPLFMMVAVGAAVLLLGVGLFLGLRGEDPPAEAKQGGSTTSTPHGGTATAPPATNGGGQVETNPTITPLPSRENLTESEVYRLARKRVYSGVDRATDQLTFLSMAGTVAKALERPKTDPDKKIKVKKGSRSDWQNVMGRRHLRKVTTRSYVKPLSLFFGG